MTKRREQQSPKQPAAPKTPTANPLASLIGALLASPNLAADLARKQKNVLLGNQLVALSNCGRAFAQDVTALTFDMTVARCAAVRRDLQNAIQELDHLETMIATPATPSGTVN